MQRRERASLGILSGRLQGGFSASSLPRSRPSGYVARENAVITVAVPSPSASNSEISSNQSQEGSSSSDIQTHLLSLGTTLRAMQDLLKTMNHKLLSMEQQQVKLNESVRELNKLLKSQERQKFTIKGSCWEVKLRV